MGTETMQTETRHMVRDAARLAMDYWPNAHLGDCSRRQDLRSAFYQMRCGLGAGDSIQQAAGAVEMDAYRHANM